jgi:HlyD family secretion protein
MDVPIAKEITRKKRMRRILWIVGGLLLTFSVILLAGHALRPTLNRAEISVSVATVGDVENTINASGEVMPEFEENITASLDGSIQKVLKEEGSRISPGQVILTLDKSITQAVYEKEKLQLESKRNDVQKLKFTLSESFSDIQNNNAIKQLNIGSLRAEVDNARKLYDAGGGTRAAIDQAEYNLKVAELEKTQLETQIRNSQQTMQLDIKAAELAADMEENDLRALGRKLDLASVTSQRGGIVTYVNRNIGTSVREGETLARIADLSSFKVSGTISDNALDQIKPEMTAIIRTGDSIYRGHIANIYPAVQNGTISFDIAFEQPHLPGLHPHMKVDVFLVTAVEYKVLRVTNGPAFRGSKNQDVFVLDKGRAKRVNVQTGLSNFDFVEIQKGLHPGDTVITTDMSDYKNTTELDIKN